jgi:hypothetical protein
VAKFIEMHRKEIGGRYILKSISKKKNRREIALSTIDRLVICGFLSY